VVARVTQQFHRHRLGQLEQRELVNSPTSSTRTAIRSPSPTPTDPGSPLAGSPPFQGNLRARYEWDFNNYNAFVQVAGTHQGHSYATTDRLSHELSTTVGRSDRRSLRPAGFSTLDAAAGLAKMPGACSSMGAPDRQAGNLFTNYNQWIRMTR